jgi:MoxR-like ATPase
MVRSQRLVAAAALIDGRSQATDADLWPLYYVMPDAATQAAARDLLSGLWAQSRNQALGTAALEASAGPLARADRLIAAAKPLLDHPVTGDGQAGYRLRLEGIAREIDASFAPNKLPPGLAELRASLVARLT